MKVLAIFILVLLPAVCYANPFLVCDPQAGVTKYIIELNGNETEVVMAETDGSLKYDLAGLPPGSYIFKAKCAADYWWSDYSDPFATAKPPAPGGVRLSVE